MGGGGRILSDGGMAPIASANKTKAATPARLWSGARISTALFCTASDRSQPPPRPPPSPSSLPPTLKHIGIHGMSNVHLGGPNGSKLERGNSISTRAVTAKRERERERGGSVPVASRRSPLARNKQPVCLKQTTGAPRCHARTCPTDTSRRRFCCCKRCQHEGGGGGGGGRSAKTGETEPRTNGYR